MKKCIPEFMAKYRIDTGDCDLLKNSLIPIGAFYIPFKNLQIISSTGLKWDHVSVCKCGNKNNIPSWDDMCYVKDLFFEPEEVVFQLHPKKSEYINTHKGVLHLWKPQTIEIPCPPMEFV